MDFFLEGNLPPFAERRDVVATISGANCIAENVHLRLVWSKINELPLKGQVIGTKETAIQMLRLMRSERLSLRSVRTRRNIEEVSSDKVVIASVKTSSDWGTDSTGLAQPIADIFLDEISLSQPVGRDTKTPRHLVFLLTGPSDHWPDFQISIRSADGSIENRVHNKMVYSGKRYGFSIEILPHYFYDDNQRERKTQISTNVRCIRLTTKLGRNDLPTNEFLSRGMSVAEDLVTLGSFLSRSVVTWYGYYLTADAAISSYFRSAIRNQDEKIDIDDLAVAREQLTPFIRHGLRILEKLRSNGFDMSAAIRLFAFGHRTNSLRDQYISVFLSLEHLVWAYVNYGGKKNILSSGRFRSFRRKMADIVDNSGYDDHTKELLRTKLPELNRFSFKSALDVEPQ